MFEAIGTMGIVIISYFGMMLLVLSILMPLFIFQMKNELVKIRTTVDALGKEIEVASKKRLQAEAFTKKKQKEIAKLKWEAEKKKEQAAYDASAAKLQKKKTTRTRL